MATTPEGKLKKEVKAYLKEIGAWYYMPVQNGMGVVGIPDIVGCYKGFFFAIETKAPVKNPRTDEALWKKATANQQARISEICGAGGVAIVTDNLQRVKDMITVLDIVGLFRGNDNDS